MKNGYYLSIYAYYGEVPCLKGAFIRHDQNMSLWKKSGNAIQLVRYWEFERYTRIKQHAIPFFNKQHLTDFVDSLLREYGLAFSDMIEVWGTSGLETSAFHTEFSRQLGFPLHTIAHMFSAFSQTSFFDDKTLVLSLDGGPDNVLDYGFRYENHYCAALVDKGSIEYIKAISSPAYFWAEASEYYSLREGTLMALAEACEARCSNYNLQVKQFRSMRDIRLFRENFQELVKTAQKEVEGRELFLHHPTLSKKEIECSMVMKQIQLCSIAMVENHIAELIQDLKLNPKELNFAIVGGYALNCPTNTHILRKFDFKAFVSPPCVNDCGISMGYALINFLMRVKNTDISIPIAAYQQGKCLESSLEKLRSIAKTTLFQEEQFVKDIRETPVIWFEGQSEIGPRALGHRSILADPTQSTLKETLNRIKERQWWRPVAPIVLAESAKEWFVFEYDSPYMLHAPQTVKEKIDKVPAIAHINGTARLQTVDKSSGLIYRAVKGFYTHTGIPMLCNTSLNDKGEPIIETLEECLYFAAKKGIHILYIEGYRIEFSSTILENINPYSDIFKSIEKYENYASIKARLDSVILDDYHLNLFYAWNLGSVLDVFSVTNNDVEEALRNENLSN